MILLEVLVPVLLHQLGNRAVWRAELDDAGIQRRHHLTAQFLDFLGGDRDVVDLGPPMVDARANAGKLCLGRILAVVDHQRQVDGAVGQMARDMPAVLAAMRGDLAEAEHVLVEPRRGLKVFHLQRDMDNLPGMTLLLC